MKTAVYRYFDAKGTLLYVGKSGNVFVRNISHRYKSWFESVATITLEWFDEDDYWTPREAERRAIREERPLYNACRYTKQQRLLQAEKDERRL